MVLNRGLGSVVISIALTFLYAAEPIKPLPEQITFDLQKATLGKQLFFDPILSKDHTISCAHCHDLENGGDDGHAVSFGFKGQTGAFNAPTVYNSSYNFRQFWDGRVKSLQVQASGPITNPLEMANDEKTVISTLKNSQYKEKFEALYKDGVTMKNLTDAIAEFEKALVTKNAPFDRYLRGDENAISEEAKTGYQLFKSKGCISCHHGIGVGGNHYNKFGVMEELKSAQYGRYAITGEQEDKFYFKVPSLRNVAQTAPYFHDGRTNTLTEAVKTMSLYQLGRHMTDDEIKAIAAFLETLNGDIPDIVKEH